MTPQDTTRAIEQAYRRGFTQGAYMAHFQARDGFTHEQLVKWRNALEHWRFNLRFEKTPDLKKTSWPHWKSPPELYVMKGEK